MSTGTPSSDSNNSTSSETEVDSEQNSNEVKLVESTAVASRTEAEISASETATHAETQPLPESNPPQVTPTATQTVDTPAQPQPLETAEPASAPANPDGPLKRRIQLAPTVVEDKVRPVGTSDPIELGVSSGSSETPIPKKPGPVEIPNKADLDADLEAQLEAAMTGAAASVAATDETAESDPEETLEPGARIKGKVIQIHGDNVFLDAGLRPNVIVPLRQFASGKQPGVGDELEVLVAVVNAEEGIIEARLPTGKSKIRGNWSDVTVGQIVDCMVTKSNKGGLEVTISSLRGFLPSSQIELGYCNDLEKYVGEKIQVQITEVNPKKRNLVVSRRKLLQAERAEAEKGFWEEVEVGQTFTGRIKTIKNYGAFVDIGPIDGFLHIGEISWSHVNHPNEVLKEDQTVDVKVVTVDPEKRKIALSMRQLMQDPWASVSERYAEGRTVEGRVTRTTQFGAFVELERGVEGLVHISQLAWRRVGSVNEVLKVADVKDFQVLEVDTSRKRISLSLKALEKKPESAKADDVEEAPRPKRKPRTDLRGGGTGSGSGGGLFGNPNDFK